MLAARFYGAKDIRVEEVAVPQIKAADDVLVEVHYCGICGTDLHEYLVGPIVTPKSPHPLTGATLPQTLGHEFSATVVEIGSDVRDVKVGDRVSVNPIIWCGRCHFCRRGLGQLCQNMACTGLSAETGALANFAVVKEQQLAVLPDAVSDLEGAVIEPACVAAYGVDRAGVVGGDIVLVTGAGPIGVLSAMYASAIGAATVVIAEPNPNRAALARAMDIGPVVDPTADGFGEMIRDLTGGVGVDLAVECSGTGPGLTTAIASTRARGNVVQTGLHTKPASVDMMFVANTEVSIIGSLCYYMTDWPRVIRLVAAGKYPVAKAVTTTIPLVDVVTAGFDVLVDPTGDQLKVLVKSS
jgi:(R,R)-butanediol dehydrogenase/meso-butanediol dehydrogenase/diacetyl reductase